MSFRRSSVSASLFRSSQTLCICVKQVSYICVASVVSSRLGTPLAIASVLFCCVSIPTRIAIRCSAVALPSMLL